MPSVILISIQLCPLLHSVSTSFTHQNRQTTQNYYNTDNNPNGIHLICVFGGVSEAISSFFITTPLD